MTKQQLICDKCSHRDGWAWRLKSKYNHRRCPRDCKYAINILDKARKKFDSMWDELKKRECPNCRSIGTLTMTSINHYVCSGCGYRGVI